MEVEVVRSARRRRTVQARIVGDILEVSIPASMSRAEEEHWVAEMLRRAGRQRATSELDLTERARELAHDYGVPLPETVRWVNNQRWRWGSCTPADGSIRISSRLANYPRWVIDYVLLHEMAHLDNPTHDASFWSVVDRFPQAERARGYLIAKGEEADPGAL